MSRRARIAGFGSAGLLVLLGIACAVIFSGALGQNLAFVLVALGLVLATSLVFYEVGLSEDRERAREQEASERKRSRRLPRTARPKLDRSRGQRRRLG